MSDPLPAELTQLLDQWSGGEKQALDSLMPLVYEELRRMAQRHMARERPDHTLQATAPGKGRRKRQVASICEC